MADKLTRLINEEYECNKDVEILHELFDKTHKSRHLARITLKDGTVKEGYAAFKTYFPASEEDGDEDDDIDGLEFFDRDGQLFGIPAGLIESYELLEETL